MNKYFFPAYNKTIKAETLKEAKDLLNKPKKDVQHKKSIQKRNKK